MYMKEKQKHRQSISNLRGYMHCMCFPPQKSNETKGRKIVVLCTVYIRFQKMHVQANTTRFSYRRREKNIFFLLSFSLGDSAHAVRLKLVKKMHRRCVSFAWSRLARNVVCCQGYFGRRREIIGRKKIFVESGEEIAVYEQRELFLQNLRGAQNQSQCFQTAQLLSYFEAKIERRKLFLCFLSLRSFRSSSQKTSSSSLRIIILIRLQCTYSKQRGNILVPKKEVDTHKRARKITEGLV